MFHLDYLQNETIGATSTFFKKASGRYYTSRLVGSRLIRVVTKTLGTIAQKGETVRVVDPFGGDGRLLDWLITSWWGQAQSPLRWNVTIWDLNDHGFPPARERFQRIAAMGVDINADFKRVDSFREACHYEGAFDIVLTNPPWELLKPDRRELDRLPKALHRNYIEKMRSYDHWIAKQYPRSQPQQKFAGWGTNLSRTGLEVCLHLTRKGGLVGAVLPASILADHQSWRLRKHLLVDHAVLDFAYYPAEAKQYGKADVSSITMVLKHSGPTSPCVPILTHGVKNIGKQTTISLDQKHLEQVDYVLPVAFGTGAMDLLASLASRLPKWHQLESAPESPLWAGRELDETGSAGWLQDSIRELPPFIKGRMIERYRIRCEPNKGVARSGWGPPPSTAYARIAWRDVSRSNQKRRMIATLIPPNWVAGNSLGVAYFRSGNEVALRALLAVMNSTVFEFQLRAYLATGHVSLSSLRKVALPSFERLRRETFLAELVSTVLNGDSCSDASIDAYVAKRLYHLRLEEYSTVLSFFQKITESERTAFLTAFQKRS